MFRLVLSKTATTYIPKTLAALQTAEVTYPKTLNTLKNISKGAVAGGLVGSGIWAADKLSRHPEPRLKLHKSALFGATFFAVTAAVVSHPIVAGAGVAIGLATMDVIDGHSIVDVSIKRPGNK